MELGNLCIKTLPLLFRFCTLATGHSDVEELCIVMMIMPANDSSSKKIDLQMGTWTDSRFIFSTGLQLMDPSHAVMAATAWRSGCRICTSKLQDNTPALSTTLHVDRRRRHELESMAHRIHTCLGRMVELNPITIYDHRSCWLAQCCHEKCLYWEGEVNSDPALRRPS